MDLVATHLRKASMIGGLRFADPPYLGRSRPFPDSR